MNDRRTSLWTLQDDRMVQAALRAGAGRRDLMRMLAGGGLAAASAGAILGRAKGARAATPTYGGHIVAAGFTSSTADTLDPAKASASTDYVRCCAFYNRLTFLDEHGVTQMELAESIDSKDAKTWTVKLRRGVTFHDGHSLSSADVVFSLKRHLDPAVGSKVATLAKQMQQITAVDPQTVQIVLTGANADLPTILAMFQFMIVADGTTDFSKGNGTGAFVCQEFTPGVRSIGVKFKNYWKEGRPYLDSFEFIAISDNTARTNALLAGNVQLAANLDPRAVQLIKRQPGYHASVTTSGSYTNLIMRLDMPPGNKADFVNGMKYLMNREVIKNDVRRGLAVIANDQPISPASRYYNANLTPRAFDPDRAKFLFKKSGFYGQRISVVTSDAADSAVEMAMVLQQSAADIGMNMDVQRKPADGYWSDYWMKSPISFGNINGRPTPDIFFSLFYASNAPWNESRYRSPKFDSMMVEARGLLDEAKRTEIYHEMQVMISEQAGTAIPVWLSNVDGVSDKLHGLRPNPLGGMMGYAFAEHVWLS
jgi:peptide/nickel transport system substrate-binding protein